MPCESLPNPKLASKLDLDLKEKKFLDPKHWVQAQLLIGEEKRKRQPAVKKEIF
jgi:hypothetical protein